ncbi:MAG: threonine synthase [Candidatus Izemoplasma sp.]|nr:threonine synthase [Candidatus Izemoplasma sp.]
MVLSTRSNHIVDIETALLNGLAEDGGLYVIDELPAFFDHSLKMDNYKTIAFKLLHTLLPFEEADLIQLINDAYKHFPKEIIKLSHHDRYSFLELYHGPTFSFKDMALQLLPQLIEHVKTRQGIKRQTLVLTATSGDTGSAALAGYDSFKNAKVIVLYPKQGVSPFQEHQMNSYQDDNHHIYGIDGNFDDCQSVIKDAFQNVNRNEVLVTSANSINIGRLIAQIIYYFASYNKFMNAHNLTYGQPINVVVPSGNFGNVLSCYYAKQMGLPIHKMIIASNQNNVLTEFFKTGIYKVDSEIKQSYSPSMDISIPSNLERYIFALLDRDHQALNNLMKTLKKTHKIEVKEVLEQTDFYANYASEEDTLETIKNVFHKERKVIDPHTAVAKKVYDKYCQETQDDTRTMIVSTASPYKFSKAVSEALSLPKSHDLLTQIKQIGQLDQLSIDPRIISLFDTTVIEKELSKKGALDQVLKTLDNDYVTS